VDVEMRHGTTIVGLEDSGKISIRNQDTTLKNVMTTLITALNKLDEKSPSGSAVTQIQDVNTLIQQLLK